jgi:hypothetical protein
MIELNKQSDPSAPQPLTDWSNEPKLRDLKQHLEDARPIHNTQVSKVDEWISHRDVTGAAAPKKVKGRSNVQPKLIRKQAEWRYPALSEPFLSTSDVYNVSPVSWEDRDAARQNEMLINHQFNTKLDKVKFIDTYVRTAVDEGTVIIRVGWEFREEDVEEEQPIVEFHFDQSFAPQLQQAQMLMQQSPSQFATDVPEVMKQALDISAKEGYPYRPVVTGSQMVTRTKTVRNQPTVEVCDYRNVVIDPTAMGDISKANFVIYSFESSLSDLKKDGRYKNLEQIEPTMNSPLAELDHSSEIASTNFNFSDKPRTKFVVYEYWGYWDIDGDGIAEPIVAAWVGNVMIRLEENPYPDKQVPFVLVQYLPIRRSNYGEPDGALLIDNQKITGALTRGMVDLMGKSANAQQGVRKDALDTVNRRKFDNGEDFEYNPGSNPAEAFWMGKFPEIPNSAPLMLQMQHQEAESLTGVNSFGKGITGNSLGDVAAGVRGALDAASKRETAILRRLASGIVEVGRKIVAMNAQFLSEEEVIRVTNEEFVKIRRDDLAGNFDLKLSISTAEEDDSKAQQLAFILQTVGPNTDPELSKMVLGDICRLRKMPDLAHKIESYQPEPDPMAVREMELKLALLEAQIATENAKAASLGSGAQLNSVKVGTEVAKTKELEAKADKTNLDFVEQESGTTQEREKELIELAAEVKPKPAAPKK